MASQTPNAPSNPARVIATYRGTWLVTGRFDNVTTVLPPAGSPGPRPSTKTSPASAVTSWAEVNCGDEIDRLLTFSTPTVTCCKAAGQACSIVRSDVSYGIRNATCTN